MKIKKDYLEKMLPGDMLSFSGKGFVSELIKLRTGSPISHVAGVYGNYDSIPGQPPQVLIMESTSICDQPDAISGEVIKGVQMHSLQTRAAMYEGDIFWHQLKHPLRDDQWERMTQWLNEKHSKKTKYDTRQAIMSVIDWVDVFGFASEKDFSELFCSELIAAWYQKGGLISEEYNPSEMEPNDCAFFPFLNAPIQISEAE
jgi:hypothetical protein